MENKLYPTKVYETVDMTSGSELFSGYYNEYRVPETVLSKLFRNFSKEIGISYELYKVLYDNNPTLANSLIENRFPLDKIVLLLNTEDMVVVDYLLGTDRLPILNADFVNRVLSMVAANSHVSVAEINYAKDVEISSVLIKKVDPVVIEEKFEGRESNFVEYEVGILVTNDELNTTSSRLIVYHEGQPMYLPPSYYNATSARFKKSTENSQEALEVLVLKIVEDLRENLIADRVYDFHYTYKANRNIRASFEEYNNLLRTLKKIPTVLEEEDPEILSDLDHSEDFETIYPQLSEQKPSYIWRCTAYTSVTIGDLLDDTVSFLNSLNAPTNEYDSIRDLLGTYMSTKRIAGEIAKEKGYSRVDHFNV